MSTFDGVVREIPFIRIDNFCNYNDGTKIFFLSHCHTDHMDGMGDEFFYRLRKKGLYLYTSPISARILKNWYPGCDNQLKVLCVGESTLIKIDFGEEIGYLNVFVIPAGHCPGSIMFLLRTKSTRVLYTGDFRIDNKEQFFKKYFKTLKRIDNIYLDTTFFKKQYPHFPKRKETVRGVCEIIENWLSISERNIIQIIVPANCGSEYIFIQIFKKTQQKILVPNNMYHLHKFIPEMDNIVKCNDANGDIKIHVKGLRKRDSHISGDNVCTIKVTATIWEDYEIGDSVIQTLDSNTYRVCASYHPSYTEICEFIEYLKPVEIEACVLPDNSEEKRKMMELLDGMKNPYREEVIQEEIFEIKIPSLSKQPLLHNRKRSESNILSSPPRKYSRKRNLDTNT